MGEKTIKLLDGEYWWGGLVADGHLMPYGDEQIKRDLRVNHKSNQAAPFLVSNMGRYVWSDKAFSYEFKDRSLHIDGEGSIIFEEGYKTLRCAYMVACEKHFKPNGKTPGSIMFTSPQYNSWIEMMYEPTGEKMIEYAKSIIDNKMPTGVIMIDDNWQEDYGVWKFHPARFPEPKKTIDKLHDMGFKVMLWVCNYFSPDSYTFREIEKKSYLIKDKDGNSAIVHWWNGYSGLIDLTNDEAVEWLHSVFDALMDEYGVDGFKFDAGDPDIYREDFVTKKKITATEYCKLWSEFAEKYSLNELRSGYDMGGRAIAARLCDKHHSWDPANGVASLIPNGIVQGILGYSYNCPDMIGGGEWTAFLNNPNLDEELIVRYAQCASLFPMMQFSVSPWRVLAKDNFEFCIKAAGLHCEYADEILRLALEASKTGEPITRSMEYVFPHKGYAKIIDQFMLGDEILVAPVVTPNTYERDVIFPEGKWQGVDCMVEGPCTKKIPAPINKLLYFRRICD